MTLFSTYRLTNKNVTKSKISFHSELWAMFEDMQKVFLVVEKYFTIRVEKNIIRKTLVDNIVFELKNFSYMKKAFFNNTV